MKAKELRERFAAERTSELPPLTNYAKWLEAKLAQQSTLSHDKVKETLLGENEGVDDLSTRICKLSVPQNTLSYDKVIEVLSIAMGELLHNSNVIPDSWFDITANKIRNLSVVDHYEEQKQHSHTATDLSIVGVSEEECDFCHSKTHPDNVRKICYDCSQSMP